MNSNTKPCEACKGSRGHMGCHWADCSTCKGTGAAPTFHKRPEPADNIKVRLLALIHRPTAKTTGLRGTNQ